MPPRQQLGNADNTDEPMVRNAAKSVGFFDDGIPPQLYTLWRKQVHRGVQNWTCYGAREAGIIRWGEFCEWAAGQPTMAPRGQVQYNRDIIRRNVRILYDDIAKKARNSRQSMWDTVQRARAAHRAANPGVVIQPLRKPLLDINELGRSTTGPSYMPQNPRGRAGATLLNATQESNSERARIAAHSTQAPVPAVPVPAPVVPVPAPVVPVPPPVVPVPPPAVPVPAPIIPVLAPVVPVPPSVIPILPPVVPVPPPAIPIPPPVVPVPPPVIPVPAAPVIPAGPAALAGPPQAPAVPLQAPAVPLQAPAIPLQAPAIPLLAVSPPVVLVLAGMQQVPIVIPPPSLPDGASGVAVGPLAARTCCCAVPHEWPTSIGGPPTSVRIHIITPENHTRDVACGG
ncbi:hypothetical protein L211DRAFT_850932 [Terfezia boudieri ATCC MYA-4762]|uniref:Uncharacterized protein n=1 Tax=Terfezia boudieri ATCC MYA-4762 TaxID=1051890 RepID=A0A3N4LVW5_9PEZI|nr:hypothetical protein L211DRAFT_850932 [Terfezia boudieri ATCC MYA-4762]